jgi:hypothetical protein
VRDAWQCGSPQDCLFAYGYLQHQGPTVHLRRLLENVAPCEGGPDWDVHDYHNGYLSRLQFTPGSWATAAHATGLDDFTDPYSVGANVAWWISHIDDPGSSEGWPVCWNA